MKSRAELYTILPTPWYILIEIYQPKAAKWFQPFFKHPYILGQELKTKPMSGPVTPVYIHKVHYIMYNIQNRISCNFRWCMTFGDLC